jgi:hypothetical protein
MSHILIATSNIIGIVVLVAILAVTIAVCFYLISLKDKGDK